MTPTADSSITSPPYIKTFYRDVPPKGLGSLTELVPMTDLMHRLGMTLGPSVPDEWGQLEEACAKGGR